MDIREKQIRETLKSGCEHYFKHKFQQNRHLYFEKIPHSYFGTDYELKISRIDYTWKDEQPLKFTVENSEGSYCGQKKCVFEQQCFVRYSFFVNNLLEITGETKTITFYAWTYEPYGESIFPTMIEEEIAILDRFREAKKKLKREFSIQNIEEGVYENGSIGFGFFADVLRRERKIKPKNENISHGYFYYEIAHCHGEIEICLVTALFHQKYSSDLLARKVTVDGKELFLPNLSYTDLQYLTMIGFGLERLYSFWDRVTYLLYNYYNPGFKKEKDLSFDKYFIRLKENATKSNEMLFDANSENLKWLMDFHEKGFKKIIEYRHRIVHYQMNPGWDGVLSSKFANNAFQNTNDREGLMKLKLEFDGLGFFLRQQFDFCMKGFIVALNLINELE